MSQREGYEEHVEHEWDNLPLRPHVQLTQPLTFVVRGDGMRELWRGSAGGGTTLQVCHLRYWRQPPIAGAADPIAGRARARTQAKPARV